MVIPLAPDLYSLQGLKNLEPTLRRWRTEWSERRARNPVPDLSIPPGDMSPAGYVVMRIDREHAPARTRVLSDDEIRTLIRAFDGTRVLLRALRRP